MKKLLCICLFFIAKPTWATWALVNAASATISGGSATVPSLNCAGANFYIISVLSNNAATATVTDGQSHSYTKLQVQTDATESGEEVLYYAANVTGSATESFTVTATFISINVACFSGGGATPFDQQNGNNTSTALSFQPGSVTPTVNNELIVTGTEWTAPNGVPLIDTGFAYTTYNFFTSGVYYGGGMAYKIQTTAGLENPTYYNLSNQAFAGTIATFEAGASAPHSVPINVPIIYR